MFVLKAKKQFRKDLKKAINNPRRDTDLLKQLIDEQLTKTGTAPNTYHPHQLVGNRHPHFECRTQPDFLLIWTVDVENACLVLVRCGSHAELFG